MEKGNKHFLQNHRLGRVERDHQRSSTQTPCHGQGHFLLDQLVQSPTQNQIYFPGMGHSAILQSVLLGKKKNLEKVFHSNLPTFKIN